MAVTYDINDTYCPKGHKWIRHNASLLYADCYYCKECDKIYEPTVKEVSKSWFEKNFNSPRFEQIKHACLRNEAMQKVTEKDLIKLGYLSGSAKV